MQVCVGIVNYRCSRECARAVRSALMQTVRPELIIVVDNHSADDSVEFLRGQFADEPAVRVVANTKNVGFGAAQNQAIRLSDSEFFLALNPDATLQVDYIERLAGALQTHSQAGYATGLIYFCEEDGTPTPFVFSTGHWWLRGRTAINRYYLLDYPEALMKSGEIGGASGCAVLFRRAMLDAIDLGGGEFFDETYFMYVEDVDLDWRARLAGWSCWFEKSAVGHHVGEVTGAARRGDVYAQMLTNRWLMILKNDSLGMFLRDFAYIMKYDMQRSWPTLFRYGGFRHLGSGLARRMAEAWQKRSRVARKASAAELREWMHQSLVEIRSFNDWARTHPLKSYGRMIP